MAVLGGESRLRLAAAGLEDSVSEINIAGARLAREAVQRAGRPVLVAGSVGPAASAPAVHRVPASARAETLREQIATLCDWVDLLIRRRSATWYRWSRRSRWPGRKATCRWWPS